MKPLVHILFCALASAIFILPACGGKGPAGETVHVENLYDDTISTSYTVALPDDKGEGFRITYTFFNMKRADTGNFKMTHVYMRHTGEEDTTIVNGTWKLQKTDSGKYINVYSGRSFKRFYELGDGVELIIDNSDSMIADTGIIHFREKADNDIRNSTVRLTGHVRFIENNNAEFVDMLGDTLPILKISAFPDLVALNDSVNLGTQSKMLSVLGTIQIRMAMDGRSIQRSLIVEKVLGLR